MKITNFILIISTNASVHYIGINCLKLKVLDQCVLPVMTQGTYSDVAANDELYKKTQGRSKGDGKGYSKSFCAGPHRNYKITLTKANLGSS